LKALGILFGDLPKIKRRAPSFSAFKLDAGLVLVKIKTCHDRSHLRWFTLRGLWTGF